MIKAKFQIGHTEMECCGKTPSEVFLQIQRKQDLMCLAYQAVMFGEEEKGKKLMNDYIDPANMGKLTFKALKELDIDFEPGPFRCIKAVRAKDEPEQ